MLRITTHQIEGRASLKLEGKLVGPWVAEVRECWERLLSQSGAEPIEVDLRAVSYVDSAGRALLAEMAGRNSKFVTCDCQMKAIVAEIASSGLKPDKDAQRSES